MKTAVVVVVFFGGFKVLVYLDMFISLLIDVSKIQTKSKMDFFVILVNNGLKQLTDVTKYFILNVAGVRDLPPIVYYTLHLLHVTFEYLMITTG